MEEPGASPGYMKLLSEQQEAILSGNLQRLGFSSTVRLYLSEGLREVFRRVVNQSSGCSKESWLYVPSEQLKSIRQSLIVEGSNPAFNHVAKNPYVDNGYNLYPVLVEGVVRAIIVETAGKTLDINNTIAAAIIDSLSNFDGATEKPDGKTASNFVSTLFQRDNSFDVFNRRMLDLLAKQQHNSLAALYSESDGIYTQRVVVGNLHLYDKITRELKLATAREWINSMAKERFFQPVDLLPDHPVFLDSPPNYVFIHPGARSERTDYIIAVVFPGDITLQATRNIREIARLSSMLRDTQFSGTIEILSLFQRLEVMIDSSATVDDILLEVFKVLEGQMILSRLALVQPYGASQIVVRRAPLGLQVKHEDCPVIAEIMRYALKGNNPIILTTFQGRNLSEEEAKRYYLDDVKSEACFPVKLGSGSRGLIAIGSPVEGDYLLSLKFLLSSASIFISQWCSFSGKYENEQLSVSPSMAYDDMANQRLQYRSLLKLISGYFQEIHSSLSVAREEIEMIQGGVSTTDPSPLSAETVAGTDNIIRAIDNITQLVGCLQGICSLVEEYSKGDVSVQAFLSKLPLVIKCYTKQVKDSKNISITIETRSDTDCNFSWPLSTLLGSALPFILTVIDKAIGSGVLRAKAFSHEDGNVVQFEFSGNIMGHSTIDTLLQQAFEDLIFTARGDKCGEARLKGLIVSYDFTIDESWRLTLLQPKEDSLGDQNEATQISHTQNRRQLYA